MSVCDEENKEEVVVLNVETVDVVKGGALIGGERLDVVTALTTDGRRFALPPAVVMTDLKPHGEFKGEITFRMYEDADEMARRIASSGTINPDLWSEIKH